MEWVHAEPVTRYSSMEHTRPADSDADTGSTRLSDAHGPVPGANAWGLSGGSSASHTWEMAGHSWAGDEPSSPGMSSFDTNDQSSSAVGNSGVSDMHCTSAFVPGALSDRNGGSTAPPAGPSFSSGRMMAQRDYSDMDGVSTELDLGFAGNGEETTGATATSFMSTTSAQPTSRAGDDGEDAGVVPSRAAKPPPKKKPSRPRTPKKKTKSPAPPVRRVRKVKRPHPPEASLGPNGRERAMAMLRALVDSPLSEEFHKPVVQLHPEVRPG